MGDHNKHTKQAVEIFTYYFSKSVLIYQYNGQRFWGKCHHHRVCIELDDDGFFLMNSSRKSLFLP